jgi:hypothetical protein
VELLNRVILGYRVIIWGYLEGLGCAKLRVKSENLVKT